jgi:hypothetical protein
MTTESEVEGKMHRIVTGSVRHAAARFVIDCNDK